MTQRSLFEFPDGDARRRVRRTGRLEVNPYRGCRLDCGYCLARADWARRGLDAEGFREAAAAGRGMIAAFRRALEAGRGVDREIAVGTLTDPYQPLERDLGLTQGLLREFSSFSGLSISLATKSTLLERDLPLLQRIARRNRLRVEISLMSLEEELGSALEPGAPGAGRRLELVRQLARAGISAGVALRPIVPGLNDSLASLESLIRAARRHGARFVDWGVLVLPEPAREIFLERLRQVRPQLRGRLEKVYGEKEEPSPFFRRLIATRVRELKLKYGFPMQLDLRPQPAAQAVASRPL